MWPRRTGRWTRTSGSSGSIADGTVVTADEADALRRYRAFTDTEPDATIARRIVGAKARGESTDAIAHRLGIVNDLERRYSHLSDERFLEFSFRRLLDRELDAAGRQRWIRPDTVLDRAEAIRWISSTPEFCRRFQFTALPR
jgi:hypothetical protein